MASFSYIELWESEFDNIVSERDKLKDMNIILLKLEVHDTYEEDEKITTDFEPVTIENVLSKACPDENFRIKVNGHLSSIQKDYNDFNLQYNKQMLKKFQFREL